MDHLSVPSCYKYIKTKEGEADYQRIYGVAVSAYQTKYPDAPIIKEEIFRCSYNQRGNIPISPIKSGYSGKV